MKHSSFFQSLFSITIIFLGFFGFSSSVFAQLSTDPLYVTDVSQFEIYPYASPVNGVEGFCVLASFDLTQDTTIRMRHTPFANIGNPVWTYNPSDINAVPTSYGFNAIFANGLQPATEYIVQFVEVDTNGGYHLITPDDLTDDIRNMCTPNSDGTLSANCPAGDFVVNDCSVSGVNQASQNSGNSGPSATISNVTSGENSLTFSIDTQGFQVGEVLTFVYTTDPSLIPSGNFQNAQALSLSVLGDQSILTVNLTNLQANTPYYVTVLGPDGSVVIDTTSNQSYEVLYTGDQDGSTNGNGTFGLGDAGTINVNVTNTFANSEVQNEVAGGLIQCGFGENYDCDFNALLATIDRIIKFVIYIIALPVAAILFAFAGIKLIVAQTKGKSSAMSDAKDLIWRVTLGLIITLGAWIIIKFVLVVLGYTDASGIITDILGITTT